MMEGIDSSVEARWRALWERSPLHSPFSKLEYVRAAAKVQDLRVGVHIVSVGKRDAAGAAVTWRKRGPYREAILPLLTPYSAFLLDTPEPRSAVHGRTSAFENLVAELESRYDSVHLQLPPAVIDVRVARWRGWSAAPLYTYCLREAERESWSRSAIRNFESGRDKFELVEGPGALRAAAVLSADSYRRHGRTPPLEEPRVVSLFEELFAAGLASGFAVRRKRGADLEAAVAILRSDATAYYWIAGGRPGEGMTVLIGEMLPKLFSAGVRTLDFVGANVPSIAEFKRRFGTELVPYFQLSYCGRLDLKVLYAVRKMLRSR